MAHTREPLLPRPEGAKSSSKCQKKGTEPVGEHTALLQHAGHTPGSAWQQFLSAGAWYHTVTADQLGCYDHQVKRPHLVTLNETKISQFSTNWVSGQATQCRARYVCYSGNTSVSYRMKQWKSSKIKIRAQKWKINQAKKRNSHKSNRGVGIHF